MWDVKKGFSLIELIAAMAILAILSAGVISLLGKGPSQYGRDVKRQSDLEQVRSALEIYRNSNSSYPVALPTLMPSYVANIPVDPLSPARAYSYTVSGLTYTLCASLEKGSGSVAGCGSCVMTCNYKVTQP